jgi:hypothetical protein
MRCVVSFDSNSFGPQRVYPSWCSTSTNRGISRQQHEVSIRPFSARNRNAHKSHSHSLTSQFNQETGRGEEPQTGKEELVPLFSLIQNRRLQSVYVITCSTGQSVQCTQGRAATPNRRRRRSESENGLTEFGHRSFASHCVVSLCIRYVHCSLDLSITRIHFTTTKVHCQLTTQPVPTHSKHGWCLDNSYCRNHQISLCQP